MEHVLLTTYTVFENHFKSLIFYNICILHGTFCFCQSLTSQQLSFTNTRPFFPDFKISDSSQCFNMQKNATFVVILKHGAIFDEAKKIPLLFCYCSSI